MMQGTVISLCDRTGNMCVPWLEAGYTAITVDLQPPVNPHAGRSHLAIDVTRLEPEFALKHNPVCVFCFPRRTDTAVSRARWFRDKGLDALIDALRIVSACRKIAEASGAPWMLENPVSTISTYWREPDHTFHPADYTGFELGDNYTKKTCLWTGGGFVMPPPAIDPSLTDVRPDNRIHFASPGEDRANFRSATPMGFARAVFQANAPTHSRIVSR